MTPEDDLTGAVSGIAIVGMSGRFPGAKSVAEFWNNQLAGVESISHFTVEELEIPRAAETAADPNYVRSRSMLKDVEFFDADFFGILPKEAALIDPQHRLFLECCWEAFEDAGYDPAAYPGPVGVMAGAAYGSYFLQQVCAQPGFTEDFLKNYQIGNYQAMMGNYPDYLATRVAYKLNLKGPAFSVQSACSTSLVAVCQACQSLLTYQADMMLAGGVSITLPQKRGYLYQEGGMGSADGHCKPFDADAQGTVFGSGVGVVLLKRLEDAIADGDQVYAVIRGFATNNDGGNKIGYTAPSIEGQANVVAMAQQAAGIEPDSIGYIEAHGTATPLGDPIELAALEKAFRANGAGSNTGFCTIGTAKSNVGHLDIAAGVTGLIHAAHVVRHAQFPPTLNFKRPTDKFDMTASPFHVNAALKPWESEGRPRRAGVSAFGVGGTNAHVVIEEAPRDEAEASSDKAQLLVLSARSADALDAATANLVTDLKANPDRSLVDVAYTLQVGRRAFDHRRAVVAKTTEEAIKALQASIGKHLPAKKKNTGERGICFMFPGQGSQYVNMGRELYRSEPMFRESVDQCCRLLRNDLGLDLLEVIYPADGIDTESAAEQLKQTSLAQPAIFVIEYALAQLWMSWGIQPSCMIGHSIGEFVAACLAGVLSLEDALHLVAVRGRLMQTLPAGTMLSVRASEAKVLPLLGPELSLAALNAPSLCVVSGATPAVEALELELTRQGIVSRRLHTSHAFHSPMMDPIMDGFREEAAKVKLSAPQIPYVSTVTGEWALSEDATQADYWTRHLREAVRFSAGVTRLNEKEDICYLEVGPGRVLATLARQNLTQPANRTIASSLPEPGSEADEIHSVLQAVGTLWASGSNVDWKTLHVTARRRRVSLPTYPFERKRFWLADLNKSVETGEIQPAAIPPTINQQTVANEQAGLLTAALPLEIPLMPSSTPSPAVSRKANLQTVLVEIFEDLSGLDISGEDENASFLEIGFDSLFLTQVTQSLQQKFGLKITFRQLMEDLSTLDALSTYIDGHLAPGVFEPTPSAAPVAAPVASAQVMTPAANGAAAAAGSMEELMKSQLLALNQLFAQQIAALNGGAAPVLSAPPVAAVPVAQVPATIAAAAEPAKDAAHVELKGYVPFRAMQKKVSGDLKPKQEEHIRKLVALYTSRTAKSKAKTQEYRPYLADPRVVAGFKAQWKEMVYPIITDRSKGSRIWDIDGNEYLDCLNGFGPIMLGHRPDFVEAAIEKQLHLGFEIGPQTLLAGEVAQALCEMTGNERATFCNTGSEAVMAAMRVARTVSGKNRVVYFAGDYHGMFDEVLVKGFKRAGQPQSAPLAPGIPRDSVANMTVLEYGSQESLEWIRSHAHEIAAVLVEPVQSRHPALRPIEFLKELRKITEEGDVCMVFDEVVTGFRVHPGGCQALFGIRADLATYGKVIAGGMPMGILAGKAKYMDALDGGMWQYGDESIPEVGVTFFAGTFVRHPLAMAACKAVLEHLKQEGPALQERLTARTTDMISRINALFEKNQVPTHIESFSSFFYFHFPADFRFGSLFYYHLRAKGIHLLENFPCFITTEHTAEDVDRIVRAVEETIAEMQAGEILPLPAGITIDAVAAPVEAAVYSESASITESQIEILLSAGLSSEANCSFNESLTLYLKGALNVTALTDSLSELIARYDALRASFDLAARKQSFAAAKPVSLAALDLSSLDAASQKSKFDAFLKDDAHLPFDLAAGPMYRVTLVKLASDRHAFVFTAHHVVCDGWSINVMLDELSKIYSAKVEGKTAQLDPLMSFATYANDQEAHFAGAEGAQNEAFWLKRFEVLPPLLDLPLDHPRPAMKSFPGATYRKKISAAALKDIKRAGAQQKCTLFATMLAGFTALLGRLSGQEDIVVGVPAAGQSLVEDKVLVGHCVNFVPIRGVTHEEITTAQFLQQMRANIFDAYDHQNYTFGRLVRKLAIQRDSSRLPLLEVQFNLEKVGGNLAFAGLTAEVDPNPKSFVNFDVFINAVEGADGVTLHVDYNTILIDESTIARWMDCYETLLMGLTGDASKPLALLPILTSHERELVSVVPNQTHAAFPKDLCVHQLFEKQAAATPHAIALQCESETLTYSELDARVNKLARYLVASGVLRGEVVGIYMERSVELVVSLLATWKAGATYIPLDPTFPLERLKMVFLDLERPDLRQPTILTQSRLAADLPSANTRLICVDERWPVIEIEDPRPLQLTYSSSAVAYVIYTSGSTGRPKGVEVTQSNVVNLLLSMAKKPGLTAKDVLVAVTTISFDIAALEVYLPLITGARLVMATRPVASDGTELLKLLRNSKATVMQATPVTFRLLLAAGWKGEPTFTAWCGGEALPRDLVNQVLALGIPMWNMYGPTETTIWSATSQVVAQEGPVHVGPPIDNTQFYVLDTQRQLVPTGVAGELYIGGEGVAKGYFERPELTAERFISDPFCADGAGRLYRTGDLVRRLSSGDFDFLGRADGQIKLRGFRIELGEIETALAKADGVSQAVVLLREDTPGDKRLVAYLEVSKGSAPASNDLRSFLLSKLPDYMVPTAFVTLARFPLTANAKIDRKALPAPDRSTQAHGASFVAPRNFQEEQFAQIWADVLHLERVGIEDNIFELGADSLHVFQIAARANQAGIEVKPRQILQYRKISAVLADLAASGPIAKSAPLTAVSRAKYRISSTRVVQQPEPVDAGTRD